MLLVFQVLVVFSTSATRGKGAALGGLIGFSLGSLGTATALFGGAKGLAIASGGAFVAGTGFNAGRQGLQMMEDSNKQFSWSEMAMSGGMSAAMLPGMVVAPWLTIPVSAGLGLSSAADEFAAGHPVTGTFDAAMSLLPFANRSVRNGIRYRTDMGTAQMITQLQKNGIINLGEVHLRALEAHSRTPRDILYQTRGNQVRQLGPLEARTVGRNAERNALAQQDVRSMLSMEEFINRNSILVDQSQVNTNNTIISDGRPDVGATYVQMFSLFRLRLAVNKRLMIEYDAVNGPRSTPHLNHRMTVDTNSIVILKRVGN